MALTNIETNIILDLYDHDLTPTKIKAIALDSNTRYVSAVIRDRGGIYDVGQNTSITLTVMRPDKVGVQITGEPVAHTETTPDQQVITTYGAYAELSLVALAVKGNLKAQFMLKSGDQVLRTEIFTISCGEALDASTDTWAGEYQGYNLDELVQNVNSAVATVEGMEQDASELKSGFNDLYNAAFVTDSASGSVAHFVDGADSVPMKSLKVNIEPVQSGSGDPSPDNVRPISGWTGVRVAKAGKNLISPLSKTESGLTLTPQSDGGLLINGTYTGTTGWFVISSYVSLKAGQAYALSAGGTENTIGLNGYGGANPVTPTADFTSNLRMRIENGQTFDNVVIYPQVEVGATPTEFEIGASEATNISLSSAGTVYGGTLDVVSGVLTVDKVTTVGLSSYQKASGVSDGGLNYYDFAPSNYKLTEAIISSHLPMKTGGSAWASATPCATANATRLRLYIEADTESSYADIVVVYTLAAPITYNLTPTEVKSFLGINNIWADAGDVTAEYRADTKLYIKRLTDSDTDMVADSNITSGKYFMVGNDLYRATVNIASGAQIVVGTNATKVSLSEALNQIKEA